MNLTGIDDEEGIYLKHFYDSMLITKYLGKKNISIADIGTGAGFPGIVLALAFPENNIYLVEPLQKRYKFLKVVIERLQLNNVIILNKRAEELEREKYDVIVSRAVSRLNILLELTIPFLKVDGLFIAMKGQKAIDEVNESEDALYKLGSKLESIDKNILPIENSEHINLLIRKIKKTSIKYPRNYGQIKKKPL